MDIFYLHPAKQEVDARYDKFVASPPYPFIPVGVIGFVNLLRAQGWAVPGGRERLITPKTIAGSAFCATRWSCLLTSPASCGRQKAVISTLLTRYPA